MIVIKKTATYLFDNEQELKSLLQQQQSDGYIVTQMEPVVLREGDGKLMTTVSFRHEDFLVEG